MALWMFAVSFWPPPRGPIVAQITARLGMPPIDCNPAIRQFALASRSAGKRSLIRVGVTTVIPSVPDTQVAFSHACTVTLSDTSSALLMRDTTTFDGSAPALRATIPEVLCEVIETAQPLHGWPSDVVTCTAETNVPDDELSTTSTGPAGEKETPVGTCVTTEVTWIARFWVTDAAEAAMVGIAASAQIVVRSRFMFMPPSLHGLHGYVLRRTSIPADTRTSWIDNDVC
jgi:hypothetical protein